MADSNAAEAPSTTEPRPTLECENPITQPDPTQAHPLSSSSSTPPPQNPNPNNNSTPITPPPPTVPPFAVAASFRPAPPIPPPTLPQFSPVPMSSAYPVTGVLPPGVSGAPPVMMPPPAASPGAPQTVSGSASVPPMMPYGHPGHLIRPPYATPQMIPNAYAGVPQPIPQGAMPPPGMPRYATQYMPVVRSTFPPRLPGAVGLVPPLSRPPLPGFRAPIVLPVVRPAVVPSVAPTEKAQTTVYVGKIASTVENDFILSVLKLCGPVKSWKPAQDPSTGALKGFGFCEFESAEGVLRALRLLSKLNIDGQELMLNVKQATREYLERYVKNKVESFKNQQDTAVEGEQSGKQEASEPGAEKNGSFKLSTEASKITSDETKKDDDDMQNKEKHEPVSFGLVTDEDKKSDQEALMKLTGMIEERLKNKPLPPPPPPPPTLPDASANSTSELEKGGNLDVDVTKREERNQDELPSDHRPSSEPERTETSSPDRSKQDDRRSRDRERDSKRDKERELERYEREREQDRAKREKEREYKIREDERRYKAREKDWELREREREHWRKREREREKERAQERKWEIIDQECESDGGYTKKRKYRGNDEEKRRRQREKEEDLADKLREEEEIAEARRRAEEEQKQQLEALKALSRHTANGIDKSVTSDERYIASKDKALVQTLDHDSVQVEDNNGEVLIQNGTSDESDMHQINNAPSRKLGFGLQGSGKRAAVPSVFNEDEEEDAQKEKKMRPLVPLDYSNEEQQAVQPPPSEVPSSNLVEAAEFAKRISNVNTREERPDVDRERSRRHQDRSSQRERDRHHGEWKSSRDESTKESSDRDKVRDHGTDKGKSVESKKLLDAKQLIDMIPKTKDELFSYEINWDIYEEHNLHERMKPWISKKITEFLGEEEPTLVEYIVSTTHEHVKASTMLEHLQAILDEEAEMFVLKMWRMLIFEIKKVETGLAFRSKT